MIPALHMYLLGDFLLVSDDTPVTTVNVSRVQSLLAYLVLHRSSPQDRSHLAYLLWPDSTEAQAHSNLVWLTEIARLAPTCSRGDQTCLHAGRMAASALF